MDQDQLELFFCFGVVLDDNEHSLNSIKNDLILPLKTVILLQSPSRIEELLCLIKDTPKNAYSR